ncbi:hypothetical protein IMSAGC022_00235 [Alistipes sp.]|nr:hypothetical protein IMSAGC022_00235 [Alistipes sp.]
MAFIAYRRPQIATDIYNSRNYMAFIADMADGLTGVYIYNSRNYMAFIAPYMSGTTTI